MRNSNKNKKKLPQIATPYKVLETWQRCTQGPTVGVRFSQPRWPPSVSKFCNVDFQKFRNSPSVHSNRYRRVNSSQTVIDFAPCLIFIVPLPLFATQFFFSSLSFPCWVHGTERPNGDSKLIQFMSQSYRLRV
jgi:hypothetical protein